ncbi:PDZ domain-containing protein [Paenibacillus filicis]|uniref:PDZ domain-containing protein n=1 Tax=Paenibacillus gyeongsangnamensis TaxID=3388067 RepID=A0ABT4QE14_9BACL|nr:PDZ domain-containing protein [Paenibacillus filicis]MCZ8514915.1 PDZ domain-containing protein [Paenibacillus filicis]
MTLMTELASRGLQALLQQLLHPFYYVGVLFIVLQYRRQIAFERKLFSTKLHSLLSETWRTVLWGWVGGLLASAMMAAVGATVEPEAVILLWLISLVLILIKVRFLCWAYAVGILGVLQVVLSAFPVLQAPQASWLIAPLMGVSVPSMLALVAVLHLVEAVYVRTQGHRFGTPMFFESKRGKIVGGYQLQGFWPIVLFLIVPMQGGSSVPLPWMPLLGGDVWAGGWTIIGFPVMIGFAEMTLSRLPKAKVRLSSSLLALYSLVLLAFAALAACWPFFTLPAALLSILLHEAAVWYSRWDEEHRNPIFVHSERGLKILGVLPGSPAEELGLVVGETVHKVNGMPVRTKRELHQAMQTNPAFCRLEILNLEGESKFVKRGMFSGEHHQLGIILAPDQDVLYYAEERQAHIFAYLSRRLVGLLSKRENTRSM